MRWRLGRRSPGPEARKLAGRGGSGLLANGIAGSAQRDNDGPEGEYQPGAESAAPRSCGGRGCDIDGAVIGGPCHWVYSAYTPASRQPTGPVQASRPPRAAAHSRPIPVIPVTLRSTSSVPPTRCAPVPAAASAATATVVSASTEARRRNGSHGPPTRSGSPNGLAVVTVMTVTAATSNTSGSCRAP